MKAFAETTHFVAPRAATALASAQSAQSATQSSPGGDCNGKMHGTDRAPTNGAGR